MKTYEKVIYENKENIAKLTQDVEWLKKTNWVIIGGVIINIVVNLLILK